MFIVTLQRPRGERHAAISICWHTETMDGMRHLTAALLVIGLAACASDSSNSTGSAEQIGDPKVDMSAVETFDGLARNHVDSTVDYAQSPPVGGDHSGQWQNCGVYDAPVANENAVHSMEHGAVWLAYNPGLTADQVETVRAFARNQTHVLVSPYSGLAESEALVANAWGTQLRLQSVDDPRLAEFVALYQQGPQAPELGVTCSGAKGEPIE